MAITGQYKEFANTYIKISVVETKLDTGFGYIYNLSGTTWFRLY